MEIDQDYRENQLKNKLINDDKYRKEILNIFLQLQPTYEAFKSDSLSMWEFYSIVSDNFSNYARSINEVQYVMRYSFIKKCFFEGGNYYLSLKEKKGNVTEFKALTLRTKTLAEALADCDNEKMYSASDLHMWSMRGRNTLLGYTVHANKSIIILKTNGNTELIPFKNEEIYLSTLQHLNTDSVPHYKTLTNEKINSILIWKGIRKIIK